MHKFLRVLAALAVACTPSLANADWLESNHGDAGQLLGTSQVVTTFSENANNNTSILGSLNNIADVDLYTFVITAPTTFVATTNNGFGTITDTQLFLFRSNGTGVAVCDDDETGFNFRSLINNRTGLLTTLAAGTYHLAISSFDNDALSGANLIFPSTFPGIFGPNASEVNNPLTGWTGNGGDSGTYRIDLISVSAVPVPSGIVLAGLGLAGFGGIALRRRKATV